MNGKTKIFNFGFEAFFFPRIDDNFFEKKFENFPIQTVRSFSGYFFYKQMIFSFRLYSSQILDVDKHLFIRLGW